MYQYHKYKNKKVELDGHKFDSKHEAERYIVLRDLSLRGDIDSLELQKKFVLIPAQRDADMINSKGKLIKGKVIEKECAYYADFCYYDKRTKQFVVEDAKGVRTDVYKIKKKLMLYVHNIRIKEV